MWPFCGYSPAGHRCAGSIRPQASTERRRGSLQALPVGSDDRRSRECHSSCECVRYALLAGLIPLAGCVGDRPPPPVIDTSMPVVLDYREHRILNPPPARASGRVDPVPSGPGRERDFGPESRLLPAIDRATLVAALEQFRAREPREGATLLGLAKKKKARAAKVDPDKDDSAFDESDRTDSLDARASDARPRSARPGSMPTRSRTPTAATSSTSTTPTSRTCCRPCSAACCTSPTRWRPTSRARSPSPRRRRRTAPSCCRPWKACSPCRACR